MFWFEVDHVVSMLQICLLGRTPLNDDEATVKSSDERRIETLNLLRELLHGIADSRKRNEVLHIEYGEKYDKIIFLSLYHALSGLQALLFCTMFSSGNASVLGQKMSCTPHDFGIGYHVALIAEKMYLNVLTKTFSTRRSIYYERPDLFKTQSTVDSAVNRVCQIMDLPQWDLGIRSTSKGLVYGPLIIRLRSGLEIDCSRQSAGTLIPQDLFDDAVLESDASFALVIEKDAVFQKLLRSELTKPHSRCILITGKGYPDLITRLLVKKITTELILPTFAIVDGDPHGIEIFFNYKYGSMTQCHLNGVLASPDIFWLGVHPSDMINLPDDKLIPLSQSDVSKIEGFLQRQYVLDLPPLHYQLLELLNSKKKCEIEAVYIFSPDYLSDIYIPLKISSRQYI